MNHDRFGAEIDPDARQPGSCTCPRRRDCPCVDPRCLRGYLGENDDGALIPCLTCRPHLRGRQPDITQLSPELDEK